LHVFSCEPIAHTIKPTTFGAQNAHPTKPTTKINHVGFARLLCESIAHTIKPTTFGAQNAHPTKPISKAKHVGFARLLVRTKNMEKKS
jgi:hypothetical protein